MRTDLNFEAESFAGYYPSQNEGLMRGSYFVYRNARDLVNEITADLAEFKPLNDAFVSYLLMED